MTLGGIIALVLLVISLFVFIYVIVKSARTWGVLHSILLCALFIEAWVFMFMSAGVQNERVNGVARADKAQADLEQARQRQEDLLWGNFDVQNLNLEAVIPVRGKLQRMTTDRGRVWRGLSFVQSTANGYQLDLTSIDETVDPLAQPDASAPAAASSESLPVELVVYAFAEEMNEENQPIPVFYLGEYAVAESQDGAVTLRPTLPLRPGQLEYINAGAAAVWTLYELLPLDSHETFAAEGSQPTDEELFGHMEEERLTSLFANVPEENGRRQQIIESYLRDGQRATDEDPDEAVWVQVNLLEEWQQDVDVVVGENEPESNIRDDRPFFDEFGRTIDPRLKRDGDGSVTLPPGTKILVTSDVAQELIDNGTAELVQRVYVRPLNDYQLAFTRLVIRDHEVSEAIELVERESTKLEQANQLGQEMITLHQNENQKIKSDRENFLKEVAVLEDALKEAEQEQTQLKQEINRLYRSLQSRRARLAKTGG